MRSSSAEAKQEPNSRGYAKTSAYPWLKEIDTPVQYSSDTLRRNSAHALDSSWNHRISSSRLPVLHHVVERHAGQVKLRNEHDSRDGQ